MYCIYRITNKVNGKTYIGQHKYKDLNDKYMGSGKLIRRAQKKYGMENFTKEILYSRIQYKETADDVEKFAIAKERSLGKAEYNIADGGQGCTGCKHTDEWRRKMSENNKGKKRPPRSEEYRRKLSEAKKGKKPYDMTDETRRKISEARKGKHYWSEEARRKMSETRKGRKHTEETKRKLSEAMKGHSVSEETKRKISESLKSHSISLKGKHWKLVDGKKVFY